MQKQACLGARDFLIIILCLLGDFCFLIFQKLFHVDVSTTSEQRMELDFVALVLRVCDLVFCDMVFMSFNFFHISIVIEIGERYHDVVVCVRSK